MKDPNKDIEVRYRLESENFLDRQAMYRAAQSLDVRPSFLVQTDFSRVDLQMDFVAALEQFYRRLPVGQIYVMYSGGIDSEMMLDVGLRLGFKPIPVTVDLFGTNSYDLMMARKFIRDRGIDNAIEVYVDEAEYKKKWVPELLFDLECPEFLYSAAYIAVRSAPTDGVIILGGEGPCPVGKRQSRIIYYDYENAFWALKVGRKRKLQIYDPFWSAQVVLSYLNFEPIRERLLAENTFEEWVFDVGRLGKDFYYSHPQLKHLKRRFSQHGWESQIANWTWPKDMFPDQIGFSKKETLLENYKQYFSRNRGAEVTAELLLRRGLDYEFVQKYLFSDTETELNGLHYGQLSHLNFHPTGPFDRTREAAIELVITDSEMNFKFVDQAELLNPFAEIGLIR